MFKIESASMAGGIASKPCRSHWPAPSDEPTVNARTLTPSDRRSWINLCFVLNIGSMAVFELLAAFFGALVPAENRRVHPE